MITAEVALDGAAEGEGDEVNPLGLLGRRAEGLRRQQPRRRLRQERGRHVSSRAAALGRGTVSEHGSGECVAEVRRWFSGLTARIEQENRSVGSGGYDQGERILTDSPFSMPVLRGRLVFCSTQPGSYMGASSC